ncbi:antitoxin VbhA family protein [Solibacillus sp. FSL R7-0668]|uniref:antitoxin VbhA family protein n=1 Tax=Solibacillus sp. FSL R7-0668 TaxID=2921688 RepID=UPI0030FB95E3
MNLNSRLERQKQIQFAVGMAALDGGKPTSFTQSLLNQYENGQVTSGQLKQAILQKYVKASN